jgi:large subunit ribosomal protein L23
VSKAVKYPKETLYGVILAPVITEKATRGSEYNQVTFKVREDATKPLIKEAVNTIVVQGKTKRFKGIPGKRSDWKKAIVTLAAGQTIDVTATL